MDEIELAKQKMKQSLKSYRPVVADCSFDIPVGSQLPDWFSGSIYRIGPGIFEVSYSVPLSDSEKETQWFNFGHLFDTYHGHSNRSYHLSFRIPMLQQFIVGKETVEYSYGIIGKGMERKINSRHGLPPWLPTMASHSNQSFLSQWSNSKGVIRKKPFKKPDVVVNGAKLYTDFPILPELETLYGTGSSLGQRRSNGPLLVSLPFLGPPSIQYIDSTTLDPVHVALLSELNSECEGNFVSPILGKTDDGDWVGCVMKYQSSLIGGSCIYTVFIIGKEKATQHIQLDVVTKFKVPISKGGLVHSVGITSQFIILPVYPYVPTFSGGIKVSNGSPLSECFEFYRDRPIQFHIISRATREHVGTYESLPGLFGFHVVNAWESREGTSISLTLDTVVFSDASIINHLKLENLKSDSEDSTQLPKSHLQRFTLKSVDQMQENTRKNNVAHISGDVASEELCDCCIQLPVTNPNFSGQKYRYVYGMSRSLESIGALKFWDSIVKIDVSTRKKVVEWSEPGCFVSDPIFVASTVVPSEDEGIIIVEVVDTRGPKDQTKQQASLVSVLVFLDAKSLSLISRIELPTSITTEVNSVLQDKPQKIDLLLPLPPLSFGIGCFIQRKVESKSPESLKSEFKDENKVDEEGEQEEGEDDEIDDLVDNYNQEMSFKREPSPPKEDEITNESTKSDKGDNLVTMAKESLQNIPPEELFRDAL